MPLAHFLVHISFFLLFLYLFHFHLGNYLFENHLRFIHKKSSRSPGCFFVENLFVQCVFHTGSDLFKITDVFAIRGVFFAFNDFQADKQLGQQAERCLQVSHDRIEIKTEFHTSISFLKTRTARSCIYTTIFT